MIFLYEAAIYDYHATHSLLLLIAATNALVGLFVLTRNPSHILHRSFFVFALGAGLWIFGIAMLLLTHQFIFNDVLFIGAIAAFSGLLLLAKAFPMDERPPRSFIWRFIPLLALFLLVPARLFVKGIMIGPDGRIQPVNGPLLPFFVGVIAIYFFYCIWLMLRTYRSLEGRARLQMQYFFLGISIFALFSIMFDAAFPMLGIFHLNFIGPVASVIFVISTAYAIVRYQLLDIRVVIQRGALYSIVITFLLVLYLIAASLSTFLFQRFTQVTAFISGALTMLVGVFGVPWFEKKFRKWTDHIFFKGRYVFSEAIGEVSATLNRNLDLGDLTHEFIYVLQRILRIKEAGVLLVPKGLYFDGGKDSAQVRALYSTEVLSWLSSHPDIIVHAWLDAGIRQSSRALRGGGRPTLRGEKPNAEVLSHLHAAGEERGIAVTVPITLEKKLLGVLLLSEKRSGDTFSTEDLRLLRSISDQLAVALAKAELYETVQNYSRELEDKVAQRTVELRHLYQTQTRLIQDLSHALQTPLAVMRAEIDSAQVRSRVPRKKTLATERSIDNASRLVSNLLDLARLEARSDDIQMKNFDFSRLLSDMVEYFTVVAKNQKIKVRGLIEPGLVISGDSNRIEEAVANLLSNAVKYVASSARREIKVILKRDGLVAELCVSDTGEGIDSRDLPHIFEPFYRSMHSRTGGIEGQGVGLALCRSIIERHNGSIRAESAQGAGAAFTITLPLAPPSRQ